MSSYWLPKKSILMSFQSVGVWIIEKHHGLNGNHKMTSDWIKPFYWCHGEWGYLFFMKYVYKNYSFHSQKSMPFQQQCRTNFDYWLVTSNRCVSLLRKGTEFRSFIVLGRAVYVQHANIYFAVTVAEPVLLNWGTGGNGWSFDCELFPQA